MGQVWRHMACPVSLQAQLLRQLEEHLPWPLLHLPGGPKGSCPHYLWVAMQGWPTVLRYCLHSCSITSHTCCVSPCSYCISPHRFCISPHSYCVSPHGCCVSLHAGATRPCREVSGHDTTQLKHTGCIVCALSCVEPSTVSAVLDALRQETCATHRPHKCTHTMQKLMVMIDHYDA